MSLEMNGTCEIVNKPQRQKLVGCKWIFKKKPSAVPNGKVRYKARLVAKGFSQKEGVDYNEIFSHVVKHCSIRIILSLVTQYDLKLHQMDVTTAFLHGELEEQIYMAVPEGVSVQNHNSKVCLLKKSLYGLQQNPRQWYLRFDQYIVGCGFVRSSYDSCVYYLQEKDQYTYLLLYVDDMLIASHSMIGIQRVKDILESEFDMKNLGEAKMILGMSINRNRSKGSLIPNQEAYLCKVLKRYNMYESKSVSTSFK